MDFCIWVLVFYYNDFRISASTVIRDDNWYGSYVYRNTTLCVYFYFTVMSNSANINPSEDYIYIYTALNNATVLYPVSDFI